MKSVTPQELRYLLLQVRKPEDPMRAQEVACFSRALDCRPDQINVLDLIHEAPTLKQIQSVDVVLMGGSGDYSVVEGGDWLEPALDTIAQLVQLGKATFASCWGFQAMARALGGEVVTDPNRAEVGVHQIQLTESGRHDPVFSSFSPGFLAFEGHQDSVIRLPETAVLLATSPKGVFQAFTFPEAPIYCTQFHPELDRQSYLDRIAQYPEYLERMLGIPFEMFSKQCTETPQANELLRHFAQYVCEHLDRRGPRSDFFVS